MGRELPTFPHGCHFVAGVRMASEQTFQSEPARGPGHRFSVGTPALVEQACHAAEEAFGTYGRTSREERASLLETVADELAAHADLITDIGSQETGLPAARLVGERGRTESQLRLFASHISQGRYLDRRRDEALPQRQPMPRPDLRMMQRPIGPVAVFGASNYPLAFSVAGGDTVSALAAGSPVGVKGRATRLIPERRRSLPRPYWPQSNGVDSTQVSSP